MIETKSPRVAKSLQFRDREQHLSQKRIEKERGKTISSEYGGRVSARCARRIELKLRCQMGREYNVGRVLARDGLW